MTRRDEVAIAIRDAGLLPFATRSSERQRDEGVEWSAVIGRHRDEEPWCSFGFDAGEDYASVACFRSDTRHGIGFWIGEGVDEDGVPGQSPTQAAQRMREWMRGAA